jgi:mannosyltransferase
MDGDTGASQTARPEAGTVSQPAVAASPERPGGDAAGGRGWPGAAARYLPVLAATATMAALGFWGLQRQSSMGNDEVVTRWAALLSLRQLAHLLRHVDAVHGLYYLLIHGWTAVGTSPAVIRIPSVLGMMAAVALTVIISRLLTGSAWASLFAGLIMALTPVISFYAQTARSYALVMACVLGATLVLLRALAAEAGAGATGRRWRCWAGYGALIALGGYLNEMSLLVLAAHAVTVGLARPGRRAALHWSAASAAGVVLVVPLLILSDRQSGALGWLKPPNLLDVKVLLHDYFGPVTVVAVLLAVCAIASLLPPLGTLRARAFGGESPGESWPPWWRGGGVTLPSVAAPLLVVPATLLILESLAWRPLYVDRYVLYGEAGLALLAGAGACRIGHWLAQLAGIGAAAGGPGTGALGRLGPGGRRALIWLPGVVVCACVLLLQLGPQHRARTPQSRLFDFGGPARYVAANARPGDGVLYLTDFYRKAALGYPADFRGVTDFTLAVPPARTGTFMGLDKPFPAIRRLMLGYQRIWVVGRSPGALLPVPLARQEASVLTSNFRQVSLRQFKGIQVTLWRRS